MKDLFATSGVFSNEELESRYHLEVERYVKDIEIEVNAIDEIATTYVLPAAYRQQTMLAGAIDAAAEVLDDEDALAPQVEELKALVTAIGGLKGSLVTLRSAAAAAAAEHGDKAATAFAYEVVPAIDAVRGFCDTIESAVDDSLWPLPKYREMLSIV